MIFTSSYTRPLSFVALSIGVATMANKKALFLTFMDHVPQFETLRPVFHQIWPILLVAQMPRSQHIMAIFVLITTTQPITLPPYACAWVIMIITTCTWYHNSTAYSLLLLLLLIHVKVSRNLYVSRQAAGFDCTVCYLHTPSLDNPTTSALYNIIICCLQCGFWLPFNWAI